MEKGKIQCGDLHPSHLPPQAMVKVDVIRTPLALRPLNMSEKRDDCTFYQLLREVLNGNVGCSRMYIIRLPWPTNMREMFM